MRPPAIFSRFVFFILVSCSEDPEEVQVEDDVTKTFGTALVCEFGSFPKFLWGNSSEVLLAACNGIVKMNPVTGERNVIPETIMLSPLEVTADLSELLCSSTSNGEFVFHSYKLPDGPFETLMKFGQSNTIVWGKNRNHVLLDVRQSELIDLCPDYDDDCFLQMIKELGQDFYHFDTETKELTTMDGRMEKSMFSKTEEKVLVFSDDDYKYHIYDLTNLTEIASFDIGTQIPGGRFYFGDKLLYYYWNNLNDLVVIDPLTMIEIDRVHTKAFVSESSWSVWSENGETIYYTGSCAQGDCSWGVWSYDLTKKVEEEIVSLPPNHPTRFENITVSPDGKKLAFFYFDRVYIKDLK
jgi:hypothetical protein